MHTRTHTAQRAQVAYTQCEHVTCYGISSLISCALCALHSALPPAPRNKRAANNKQQMRFVVIRVVVVVIVACGKLRCTLQCFNWKVCSFSRISSNGFPIARRCLCCMFIALFHHNCIQVCIAYVCVCVWGCMCELRCCMQWGMKSVKPFFLLATPNHFLPALVTDIAWMACL